MVNYEKLILVLEGNCISNLSPNHTLQLTTHRTLNFVRESLQILLTKLVTLSQMFNGHYICKIVIVIAYKQV